MDTFFSQDRLLRKVLPALMSGVAFPPRPGIFPGQFKDQFAETLALEVFFWQVVPSSDVDSCVGSFVSFMFLPESYCSRSFLGYLIPFRNNDTRGS